MKKIIYLTPALVLGLLAGCGGNNKSSSEIKVPQVKPAVATSKVDATTFSKNLTDFIKDAENNASSGFNTFAYNVKCIEGAKASINGNPQLESVSSNYNVNKYQTSCSVVGNMIAEASGNEGKQKVDVTVKGKEEMYIELTDDGAVNGYSRKKYDCKSTVPELIEDFKDGTSKYTNTKKEYYDDLKLNFLETTDVVLGLQVLYGLETYASFTEEPCEFEFGTNVKNTTFKFNLVTSYADENESAEANISIVANFHNYSLASFSANLTMIEQEPSGTKIEQFLKKTVVVTDYKDVIIPEEVKAATDEVTNLSNLYPTAEFESNLIYPYA